LGFYCGDLSRLYDDFAGIRPSMLISTPRIFNQLYTDFRQEWSGISRKYPLSDHALLRSNLLRHYARKMGGNLEVIGTGGAPTSESVKAFLAECFRCEISDGYGTTEAGSIYTFNTSTAFANVECKLIDVPESGYFTTDKPHARGEVLVRSSSMATGYFKDKDATDSAFDSDGWFHTGDIAELNSETGGYTLIDRKKSIFKLAQGKFIAPERIEIKLLANKFVYQVAHNTHTHTHTNLHLMY
jgi:long-subunit acyl-CoA synthetase (AMP-forming)